MYVLFLFVKEYYFLYVNVLSVKIPQNYFLVSPFLNLLLQNIMLLCSIYLIWIFCFFVFLQSLFCIVYLYFCLLYYYFQFPLGKSVFLFKRKLNRAHVVATTDLHCTLSFIWMVQSVAAPLVSFLTDTTSSFVLSQRILSHKLKYISVGARCVMPDFMHYIVLYDTGYCLPFLVPKSSIIVVVILEYSFSDRIKIKVI